MLKYDAIIIGSGQAANPLAKKLATAGWKTALIEKRFIGGTCINVGCTPTKTLIASGRVAYLVKRSADFGIHTTGISVNIGEVIRRKNEHVLASRESSAKSLFETTNLDVHFGHAKFTGPRVIDLIREDGSATPMAATKFFINTGTRPVIPPVPGLTDVPFLTSDTILDLPEIPSHLAIIGGSYIALEFGQLYRRLGSEVSIIENDTRFLHREDEDISAEIRKFLEEDDIRIHLGTKVECVSKDEKGVRLQLSTGQLVASHVLVATGRAPDTAGLNVSAAGIKVDSHGFIAVDDRLQTSTADIYALGDVNGGPQFTHISYNDHLIVYKNLIEKANCSTKDRPPVYCLFTDPELGRVGLTEEEARAKGMNIKVATLPVGHVARAWENDETRGMLKAIVNAEDKTILGAAMLSVNGGELMSLLQIAMMGRVTYDRLRDGVFAHPTFAESLNNLFAHLK
jgi:pyruvate/2-oxoglutarate dehydrogenase complex dihydrolipoamide dehydrogenase (E3) component